MQVALLCCSYSVYPSLKLNLKGFDGFFLYSNACMGSFQVIFDESAWKAIARPPPRSVGGLYVTLAKGFEIGKHP